MKEFVVKNYTLLFVILGIIVVLIAIFTWTLTQDKKFISEKYVLIATIFFGVSVALSMLSFYALHKGSSEKSVLSKEETEKIIVGAVESAFEETMKEQEKGLGGIQTKVENVNTLLGDAEEAIKKLGKSTSKIEELSDFIAYKTSNSEISVNIKHEIQFTGFGSKEEGREFQIEFSKKLVEDLFFDLEITSIGAKYSASVVPYKRMQTAGEFLSSKRNSYSLGVNFYEGDLSKEITVKHRLIIHNLDKKFDEIKIGDTVEIFTNMEWINYDTGKKFEIHTNNGFRFYFEFIDGGYNDGSADENGVPFTLKIVDIKIKREGLK